MSSTPRGLTAVCSLVAISMLATVAAVNMAVPSLGASSLHLFAAGLLRVVDAYVVAFACLLLSGGAIADRIEPRRSPDS